MEKFKNAVRAYVHGELARGAKYWDREQKIWRGPNAAELAAEAFPEWGPLTFAAEALVEDIIRDEFPDL